MSTTDDSGKEPEQQTQPVAEAGCEGEVDRSVPGTVESTGFAEIRARVKRLRNEATRYAQKYADVRDYDNSRTCYAHAEAYDKVRRLIDELIGCEG